MRPAHLIPALLLAALLLTGGCIDFYLGTAEVAVCQNAPVDAVGVDKDHCIQDAAIRMSDEELCSDIEKLPPESKCYMLIAEKEMDPKYCEYMKDNPGPTGEYSRLECLQRVAIASGDPSVCEMMGSASSSSMFSGTFSQANCKQAVGSGQSTVDIYNKNKENYVFCQDLAYTEVFHKPPDSSANLGAIGKAAAGHQRKAEVGDKLLSDYNVAAGGSVAQGSSPDIALQDGDIIVFGSGSSAPDPKNAQHYAVVKGGKVLQVLAFSQGGALDQPRDLGWFFDTRTVTNPYTGTSSTSPLVYSQYTVYRKK
jgi:hypothetical protein